MANGTKEHRMFKRYSCPDAVGWLGVFVDANGRTIAFVGLDRRVFFVQEFK